MDSHYLSGFQLLKRKGSDDNYLLVSRLERKEFGRGSVVLAKRVVLCKYYEMGFVHNLYELYV